MPRHASTDRRAIGLVVAEAVSEFPQDAAVQPQDSDRAFHVGGGPRQIVFDPYDSSTWLPTLTADQIAAIWQRSVGAVKKQCQLGRFVPAPFQVKPYRWRRADVLRHLESGRAVAFPSAVRRRA